MKRDFGLDELAAAAARGFGVGIGTLRPLPGHAHSLNFRVESQSAEPWVVKCVPDGKPEAVRRIVDHLSVLDGLLFGGRTVRFGRWTLIALRWIDGETRYPDELSPADTAQFVRDYRRFLARIAPLRDVMAMRDALALKRRLAARLAQYRCRRLLKLLDGIDDRHLELPERCRRNIHGDLHWGNFRWAGGRVAGFLDVEEIRTGSPAEDIVRYFICRKEHLRWYDFAGERRLARAFARFVREMGLARREWLWAIHSYWLRKLGKHLDRGRPGWWRQCNLIYRFGFCERLCRTVRTLLPAAEDCTVVKVVGGTVRRFMGGASFEWQGGRYRFVCDPAERDYDWLCVYDELSPRLPLVRRGRMPLDCPRERTILATQEPVPVKSYSRAYTRQFRYLLTNRPAEADGHPGYRRGEGYMVWYTGRSFAEERRRQPGGKTQTLSAIYSAKRMRHTRHADRSRFLDAVAAAIPGFVRYGKGVRPIAVKADALDGFRYTIAYENHIAPGHWTEKLADAIVCGCLPFYAGDPRIGEILPPGSFVPIPADDDARALAIVRETIAAGVWEERRPALRAARELLLAKYNLFAQLAAVIESAGGEAAPEPEPAGGCLYTRRRLRWRPRVALADAAAHLRRGVASAWSGFAGGVECLRKK